jgi:hypothetical protein
MSNPSSPEPSDPLVERQIERTLALYEGIATPAMLATMRERLREMLTTDPLAVGMMEQLRPRAVPDRSGARPVEGAEDPAKAGGGEEGA